MALVHEPPKGQGRSPFKKVAACPLTVKGSIKKDMEGFSESRAETGTMACFFVEMFASEQLLT